MYVLRTYIKPSIFRNILSKIKKVINTFSILEKFFLKKMVSYCVPLRHTLAKSYQEIVQILSLSSFLSMVLPSLVILLKTQFSLLA